MRKARKHGKKGKRGERDSDDGIGTRKQLLSFDRRTCDCTNMLGSGDTDHHKAPQVVKRIAIFGRPGSGKSVLARSLSKSLDIPLYHLDCHYFAADWVVRDKAEFLAWQRGVVDQDKWILDGNNLDSLELRYARADTVIYLNLPRYLCIWQVYKRGLSLDRSASDRPADCSDKVTWTLLRFMWGFDRLVDRYLPLLRVRYPHVYLHQIQRRADVEDVRQRVLVGRECIYL